MPQRPIQDRSPAVPPGPSEEAPVLRIHLSPALFWLALGLGKALTQ